MCAAEALQGFLRKQVLVVWIYGEAKSRVSLGDHRKNGATFFRRNGLVRCAVKLRSGCMALVLIRMQAAGDVNGEGVVREMV